MRVADRALPPRFAYDDVASIAHWPVRPVIALNSGIVATTWDANPAFKWDNNLAKWDGGGIGWVDATCAWTGMEIDTGEPDESGLFPAARCVVQLDNADGAWSTLKADGTVSMFGPGTEIDVWAHNDQGDWWMFSGFISRYDQRTDDTIEIEAFDSFSDLAQEIGTYTPGTVGQKTGARLAAILSAAGRSGLPRRLAVGIVALTAQETDLAPLEEMQEVVLSDGGVLFVDADGTVVALDRTWPAGREDQVAIPVTSANVCTADFIVWDAVISTNDDSLADRVVLENVAGLQAVSGAAGGFTLALNDQQWTAQEEGNILAQLIHDEQQPRQVSIEEFSLYLNDPNQPNIWRAVDWRRMDQLRFLHDQRVLGGGTLRVDVTAILDSIVHEITPEGWTMIVGTAKVRSFTEPILYDTALEYNALPTPEEYGY